MINVKLKHLDIKQEVSSVAGSISGANDLITNKRTIETKVLVDNNQVIVLGGLIDDDIQETVSSVPVLGKIPLLGRLFRSTSTKVVRRNLIVFLRPTIITDSNSANSTSTEKYNYIKARQMLSGESTKLIDLTETQD